MARTTPNFARKAGTFPLAAPGRVRVQAARWPRQSRQFPARLDGMALQHVGLAQYPFRLAETKLVLPARGVLLREFQRRGGSRNLAPSESPEDSLVSSLGIFVYIATPALRRPRCPFKRQRHQRPSIRRAFRQRILRRSSSRYIAREKRLEKRFARAEVCLPQTVEGGGKIGETVLSGIGKHAKRSQDGKAATYSFAATIAFVDDQCIR